MSRDIDTVIERVRTLHPDAMIEQLKVTQPPDDDGLWFFGVPGRLEEIQVESSTGTSPFIIEHCDMKSSEEAITGASIDRAVTEVSAYLEILKKRANQPSVPARATPASKKARAIQNLWDLILIVGAIVGFAFLYVLVTPSRPRWLGTLVMIIGISAVGFFVSSRARPKI